MAIAIEGAMGMAFIDDARRWIVTLLASVVTVCAMLWAIDWPVALAVTWFVAGYLTARVHALYESRQLL